MLTFVFSCDILCLEIETNINKHNYKKRGKSMFIGTCYFRSKKDAYEYFAKEDSDKTSVDLYIKEELIHIGLPPNHKLEELDVIEGRYWKKEK